MGKFESMPIERYTICVMCLFRDSQIGDALITYQSIESSKTSCNIGRFQNFRHREFSTSRFFDIEIFLKSAIEYLSFWEISDPYHNKIIICYSSWQVDKDNFSLSLRSRWYVDQDFLASRLDRAGRFMKTNKIIYFVTFFTIFKKKV